MTRRWTAPGVLGVLAAVVTVWVLRAALVLAVDGPGAPALTRPSLLLVYAAGPALLCAVPIALVARAALARTGPAVLGYGAVGLLGGALVGVVQPLVLLSTWPWLLGTGPLVELVVLPAVGGLVGGLTAGLVRRGQERQRGDGPRGDASRG